MNCNLFIDRSHDSDVFMDAVNRKTSMGLMIDVARYSVGKQFILITPQDMANVTVGADTRIHK
jgi:structural maintenance of chromosomes protein 6